MSQEDGARKYFEKLKIVEKFCSGDIDTAKKILKGEFTDIIALKGRFKGAEDEFFGLFLIFISRMTRSVVFGQSVISRTASVFHNKPFDSWKAFFTKMEKEINEAEVDTEKMGLLDGVLQRLGELKFFPNVFEWVDTNDIMNLTDRFQKVVNNVLKIEDCRVVLDFENTTSLILYEERGIKPV
ncbi:MAG TPA: hypothetical protein PK307_12335 [Spirochaetota bacterium]|nr:hypothetical protein [Spirochaetota bacterium]HOD16407.1 hypothetical protein [Spirochaetota bacterium]HPG50631.1 hypothetical protein [Spirochaetota bacterium]HPN11102.1 hypothetical protein [Spirochaetota bacterium]HQL82985.1 hypothetical protein [Spirochaetota bacterium]